MGAENVEDQPGGHIGFHSCYLGAFLLLSFSLSLRLYLKASGLYLDFDFDLDFAMVFRLLSFLFVVWASPRIRSFLRQPRLVLWSTLFLTGCVVALVLLGRCLERPYPQTIYGVVAALNVVINVLYVVPYLAWFEVYARMDMLQVLLCVASMRLASGAFSTALALTPGVVTEIALVLTPFASFLMLGRSASLVSDGDVVKAGEAPGQSRIKRRVPVRPMVLLISFSLVNAFVRSPLDQGERNYIVLGVFVFLGLYLLLAMRNFNNFKLKLLYQLAVTVMVSGVLIALLDARLVVFGAIFANGAYALFTVFATTVFSVAVYRYRLNALWIFGIAEASCLLGQLISSLITVLFDGGTSADWLFTSFAGISGVTCFDLLLALLAMLFVGLSMVLLSDRDVETTWGIARHEPESKEVVYIEYGQLVETCSFVARRFGLTQREEEILSRIAAGESLSTIAGHLCIAESTMKTHSRHIYKKLGVANRKELQEYIDRIAS